VSEVSTSLDPLGTSFARPFARKTRRISLSLSRFDLPRRPGYVSPLFLPRTRPWSLSRVGSDEITTAKVAIGDRRGRDAEGEGIEIPSGPRARGGAGTPPRLSRPLSFSRSLPLCGDRSSLSRATKGSGVAPPVLAPSPPSESVPSLRLRMRSSLSLQPLRIRAGPGARPKGPARRKAICKKISKIATDERREKKSNRSPASSSQFAPAQLQLGAGQCSFRAYLCKNGGQRG
jgi:hypothetical protein